MIGTELEFMEQPRACKWACHNNYANSSHTALSWSCVVKWIFVDKGREFTVSRMRGRRVPCLYLEASANNET